jgi:hypothetical protein
VTWTAPKTWTADTTLTAAELNAQIRDNLLHQAAPIVTGNRGYVMTTGSNELAFRQTERSVNQGAGERNSTSYGDLSGTVVGPRVTATTGTAALVIFGCTMIQKDSDGTSCVTSVAVSGATSISADDGRALRMQTTVDRRMCASQFAFFSTLNPGENTFTMQYRVGVTNNTGRFLRRRIMVMPF